MGALDFNFAHEFIQNGEFLASKNFLTGGQFSNRLKLEVVLLSLPPSYHDAAM